MRVYACVCCTSQTHRQGVACGRTACSGMIHGPPLTEQRAGQHWHLLTNFPCFGYCPKLRRVTRPRLRQRLGSLHGDRVVPCPVPGPSLTPCPWSRSDPCTLRFAPVLRASQRGGHAACRARSRHAHGESLSRTNAITATRQATPSSARGRWGGGFGPEPEQDLPSPQPPLTHATVASCAFAVHACADRGWPGAEHQHAGPAGQIGRADLATVPPHLFALTRGETPFAARRDGDAAHAMTP